MPVTMASQPALALPSPGKSASIPTEPAPAITIGLRRDLRPALHELEDEPYFLVEDPVCGRYFRVGVSEWQFACQLDGRTSLPDAYHRSRIRHPESRLTPDKVEPLCRWLLQNGIARMANATADKGVTTTQTQPNPLGLNPFFIKIPLVRPDRWLHRLSPIFGWLFTWPCFIIWLALCICAVHAVASDWSRFLQTARIYLAPQTWLYLWAIWLLLKIVHETAHGLVCKKYGGFVGEAGAALILFTPVAYVDVTSTWRFRDKWSRVFTSAAGMYAEFALAAVAALIWSQTDSVAVGYVCHAVIMAATVTTVLFNANALMRFDGYYILADILHLQNLYGEGRRYMLALGSRWFLGRPTSVSLDRSWRGLFIRAYGVAAAVWRVTVCISLVIGAGALFHGAGLAVAAFGVLAWLIIPVFKLIGDVMGHSPDKVASRRRLIVCLVVLLTFVAVIALVPSPSGMRVPAVVAYQPLETIRAQTAGFVHKVHVSARQEVSAGDPLISLYNDDVYAELVQVEKELAQSQIKAQTLHRQREIAAYQVELQSSQALAERRDHLARQVAELELRSPINGRVVDDRLDALLGSYVELGAPLLRVAAEDRKEIQVAIPEAYVESFVGFVGKVPRVALRGEGLGRRLGELRKVEPRAAVVLRHPALGANNGGPLPVEAASVADSQRHDSPMRLLAPHFHGTISVSTADATQLRDGQLGVVTIHDGSETIGRKTVRGVTNWFRKKIAMSGY